MNRYRTLLVFLLLALLPAPAAAAQEPASAPAAIERAQQAYAAGQAGQAEEILRAAIEVAQRDRGHGDLTSALGMLAELMRRQGRVADAGRCLEQLYQAHGEFLGVDNPHTVQAYRDVRDFYAASGMAAAGEAFLRGDIAAKESSLGPHHVFIAGIQMDLANLLRGQRRFAEAEPMNRRAVAIRQQSLGAGHPKLAASLYNLGIVLCEVGKWEESAVAYEHALSIYEKLPSEQVNTARTLSNLGCAYVPAGRFADAERSLLRAIGLWEQIQGPDGEAVASAANSLAQLYVRRKEPWLAEPLFQRALRIASKIEGRDSARAAGYMVSLGTVYVDQGKLAEAEKLYREAYTIWKKGGPAEERNLARATTNLADLAIRRKDLPAAEQLLRTSVQIEIRYAGPADTAVSPALGTLTGVLLYQARLNDAVALLEEYLPRLKSAFGADSEWVAYRLGDYGHALAKLDRRAEAQAAFQQALQTLQKRFGPEHSETRQLAMSYASFFPEQVPATYAPAAPAPPKATASEAEQWEQRWIALNESANQAMLEQRNPEAERQFQELLAFVKPLSPADARWQEAYSRFGSFYQQAGNAEAAEEVFRRALGLREAALGPNHEALCQNLNDLAMLYMTTEQPAKAEPLLARAAMIQERVSGPDHPYVLGFVTWLAQSLEQQGKAAEATPLFERVLRLRSEKQGEGNFETLSAKKALARNRARLGKTAEAQELFEQVLAVVGKQASEQSPQFAATLREYAYTMRLAGNDALAKELEARARQPR